MRKKYEEDEEVEAREEAGASGAEYDEDAYDEDDEKDEYDEDDEDDEYDGGGRHTLRNVLIVLLVLLVVVGAGAFLMSGRGGSSSAETDSESADTSAQADTDSSDDSEDTEEEIVEESTGTEDFVIFGVDTRSTNLSSGTRSDSIMIVHVDHDAKTVTVASIYRDCLVKIEGHGYEKITHAHSYGGPELAMSTINENFDLDIEYYMTVNFSSVGDLIDMVGGVEQDITSAEVKYINGYIDEVNSIRGTSSAHITEAGTYTLDGTQAVAFSRIRYTSGGDYKRTERQRTILFKVFEKAKTLDTSERIEIALEMIEEINTNYSSDDVTSLLYNLSQYEITDMGAYPEVFYGGTVDGAWVEVPVTLEDMCEALHEFLFGETDYEPSETVQSISSVLQGKASTANNDMRDDEEDEE